jgi:putative transcriptional regulator
MSQAALRDHLAAAYAAGALSPSLSLLVETQAALIPVAAARLAIAEATAGAIFEREAPAPLKPDSLERAFARIAAEHDRDLAPERRAASAAIGFLTEIGDLPEPIRDAAFSAMLEQNWTAAGRGIRILRLPLGDGLRTELIRIEAGRSAPRHSHGGEEITLVLAGAFSDERGRYDVGDIAVAGPGVTHRPRAEEGATCYTLAVSEAPLVLTGLLGAIGKIVAH